MKKNKELTEAEKEVRREYQRRYYANMSPEKKEKQRIRRMEYHRKHYKPRGVHPTTELVLQIADELWAKRQQQNNVS